VASVQLHRGCAQLGWGLHQLTGETSAGKHDGRVADAHLGMRDHAARHHKRTNRHLSTEHLRIEVDRVLSIADCEVRREWGAPCR